MGSVRQLADGHWVLAFSDGERAQNAATLVAQHAQRVRAWHESLLVPIAVFEGGGPAAGQLAGGSNTAREAGGGSVAAAPPAGGNGAEGQLAGGSVAGPSRS